MRIKIRGRWLNVLYCLEEPESVDRLGTIFRSFPIVSDGHTTTLRKLDPASSLCE
jgi:hypothetical protein